MKIRPTDVFLNVGKKNSTIENCLICLAISLTATFFYYEYHFESRIRIHGPMTWLLAAAIFILWIKCAFFSGRDKKFGFAVFAFLYWGLPFVYMLIYAGRDNVRGYNKWLAITNRIAKALNLYPFADQAQSFGISAQTLSALLMFLTTAAFAAGFFIKYRYDITHSSDYVKEYDGDYTLDDHDEESTEDVLPQDDEMTGEAEENDGISLSVPDNSVGRPEKKEVPDLKDLFN